MTQTRRKIDLIVGTRPNIVKLGPLASALSQASWCEVRLVFLQQHQHPLLVDDVITDMGLSTAEFVRISADSTDWGGRIGEMVSGYSALIQKDRPHVSVVFGDVDATLAAAYAAKRAGIALAHVEAGLRSHDMRMPEELNRRMVDSISDLLFATCEEAVEQLVEREGQASGRVHFAGNLMIDSLVRTLDRDHGERLCASLGVQPGHFALATFHRPSNVDTPADLNVLLDVLTATAERIPLLLPLHPRTQKAMRAHELEGQFQSVSGLRLLPPLRYRDFIALLSCARVALTDSGGLQEESSYLGIPCLTMRENTERPVTVLHGTNRLVEPGGVPAALDAILHQPPPSPAQILGWDGLAATRIMRVLADYRV